MRTDNRSRRRPGGVGGRFKIKRELIASQQADLLRQVRAGDGVSRIELARRLNLAPSTVGIYVDHLVEEGFLFEGKAAARDFGRPPTILALNPGGGRFIGVDFEARNIMAVAVDFSQRPLKQFHDTINAGDSVAVILDKIAHAIERVLAGDRREVLGIGLGVPGQTDPERGVALHYKHIRGWENVPLVADLAGRFAVPVFLENNIRTMALAELWFGQGRGVRDFICLGIRSGIGAGIIIGGQIYRGAHNLAGEIGDWPCALSPGLRTEPSPACARPFATLEGVASLQSLLDHVTLAPATPGKPNPRSAREQGLAQLVQAARAGDKSVLAELDRAARTFGLALTQLNCAFNPEKIILAGVFTAFGELFLERLERSLKEFASAAGTPRVVNSTLGEFNGALGAAALAVHEWRPLRDRVVAPD
jgi:N-acetylglucosamine repressor